MNKNIRLINVPLIFLLILIFISPVSWAATEESLIEEALFHLEQQNYQMAENLLEKALLLIWNKAPLELNNLTFTEDEAGGYGLYLDRDNNHFKSGETFFIYAEPKNYTIKEIDEELYEINFKEDIYILDMEGEILWGKKEYLDFHLISHSPNKEVLITNYITQDSPFPEGEYQFLIVIKDVFSQKTADETISFVID
ncbi:MAG TPA: hypothetical protein PK111_03125 [Atribacterota bacterium]|nr:hypothetical protein [Atribacterota bacterium]